MRRVVPKTGNLGIHVQVEVDSAVMERVRFVIDLTRVKKASGRHGCVCGSILTDERTVGGGFKPLVVINGYVVTGSEMV